METECSSSEHKAASVCDCHSKCPSRREDHEKACEPRPLSARRKQPVAPGLGAREGPGLAQEALGFARPGVADSQALAQPWAKSHSLWGKSFGPVREAGAAASLGTGSLPRRVAQIAVALFYPLPRPVGQCAAWSPASVDSD